MGIRQARTLCPAVAVLALAFGAPTGQRVAWDTAAVAATAQDRSETAQVVRVDDSDNRENVTIPKGGRLRVRLTSNPSTGYSWQLVSGTGRILKTVNEGTFHPDEPRRPGAGGRTVFAYDATREGDTTLRYRYVTRDSGSGSGKEGRRFALHVTVAGDGPWPPPTPPNTVQVDDSDDHEQVTVTRGGRLQVSLKSNPTTGFSWRIAENDPAFLEPAGQPEYTPSPDPPAVGAPGRVGVGGVTTFRFQAKQSGFKTLTLVYRQAQNPDDKGTRYQIQVFVPK